MIVEHDGRNIPLLSAHWDSSDIDAVFFDWTPMLGGASIVSSMWDVPAGWSIEREYLNQAAQCGDVEVVANGVLLSAPSIEGPYRIANMVTLSDGRAYERSVFVYVREL